MKRTVKAREWWVNVYPTGYVYIHHTALEAREYRASDATTIKVREVLPRKSIARKGRKAVRRGK